MFEDLSYALIYLGGTLQILDSSNLLRNGLGLFCQSLYSDKVALSNLFGCDRALICSSEFFDDLVVMSKISFQSNEDDRQIRAEMHDFGNPLIFIST